MSIQAVVWALKHAPDVQGAEHVVLLTLAEHADENGKGAWPSQQTIAWIARVSDRQVRRHLDSLERKGLIYRGDPGLNDHLDSDRKTVVWNLNMKLDRGPQPKPEHGKRGRPSADQAKRALPERDTGRTTTGQPQTKLAFGPNTTSDLQGSFQRETEVPVTVGKRPDIEGKTTGHLRQNDRTPTSDNPPMNLQLNLHSLSPAPQAVRAPLTELPADWKPNRTHMVNARELGVDIDEVVNVFCFFQVGTKATNWDRKFGSFLNDYYPEGQWDQWGSGEHMWEWNPKVNWRDVARRVSLGQLTVPKPSPEYACHLSAESRSALRTAPTITMEIP
ncbi:helix-turn-helix domain-containing protein [Rhodococcus rhodochrous]|uniref:helix-turn-helix domain-containing protein n=1 Tax=Rhodococcus rhodochrous TaxID=1829 RepID=UPI0013520D99|nr:helix-turn-helix domain-containing protein [Rhodococcus rhodochrous]